MMCLQGIKVVAPRSGPGLQISSEERDAFLAIDPSYAKFLPLYVAGTDVRDGIRGRYLIDFWGLSEEEARRQFPEGYQHALKYMKPFRANNSMQSRRERWWQLGVNAPALRRSMEGLRRIILTSEVSEHRTFIFCDTENMLPDGSVAAIPTDEAWVLAVLSSRIMERWALHSGGRMGKGDTPRFQNGPCFDPFPFPVLSPDMKVRVGALAELLDAHRKRQQRLYPELRLTSMYNVLEKLRADEPLTPKEQKIHEQGLVSVLKQIHDDLDAAVFDAYGWPHDLTDEEILQRLVDLNKERAEEEIRGIIRWLRPEFQNPDGVTQAGLVESGEAAKKLPTATAKRKKQSWPKSLPERMVAIQSALNQHDAPAKAKDIAAYYTRAKRADVEEMLATLVAIGNVRQLEDGRFVNYKAEAAA